MYDVTIITIKYWIKLVGEGEQDSLLCMCTENQPLFLFNFLLYLLFLFSVALRLNYTFYQLNSAQCLLKDTFILKINNFKIYV